MPLSILQIDHDQPEPAFLARATDILRGGGLVAFPTETVYGLGANALDPAAVERIFRAKGRPSRNPIIVHVSDIDEAKKLAADWPGSAERLALTFWPGPLTLVLPRAPGVPDVVTAGGATVGLRVPSHPVALSLLRAAKLPLAAPSANPANRLSPTRAEHVVEGLGDQVDLILDGGPCSGGLESTVLDLTTEPPRLLRPGLCGVTQIEAVIGPIATGERPDYDTGPLKAPGLLKKHYAPRTPLTVTADGARLVHDLLSAGQRIAWLTFAPQAQADGLTVTWMSTQPSEYAARLFAVLHEMDRLGLDRIVVDAPPEGSDWAAIRDRLDRAAG